MMKNFLDKIRLKFLSAISDRIISRRHIFLNDSNALRKKISAITYGDGNEWMKMLRMIQNEFCNSKLPTSRFLEFASIQGPMHPNQQYLAKKYIDQIVEISSVQSDAERRLLIDLLSDEQFGSPNVSLAYPQSSTLNIQHVYHLIKLKNLLSSDFSCIDSIIEFGGGYGNFARLIFKAGFNGKYTIFDFELMGVIQKYYLENSKATINSSKNISFIDDIEALHHTVKDNSQNKSLFVATWSLSESPIDIRNSIECILPIFDYIFITFQNRFHDLDNEAYFSYLRLNLMHHNISIDQCKIFENNFYFTAYKNVLDN